MRRSLLPLAIVVVACSPDGARQPIVHTQSSTLTTTETAYWVRRTDSSAFLDGPALAYDSARKVLVRFGGSSAGDTREWNGTTWSTRATTGPSARSLAAMAYDEKRKVVVLFGGRSPYGAYLPAETWEWDGSSWTLRTPAKSPPPLVQHAMTYDSKRGRVVLFGGESSGIATLSTWEWDGTTWTELTPSVAPAPRRRATLAFDESRGVNVLFGGTGYGSWVGDETWEWDGATWTLKSPKERPSPRAQHCSAYDPIRKRVVVFYGSPSDGGVIQTDLWEYDGVTWTRSTPDSGIAEGSDCVAAWNANQERIALLARSEDVWLWDGARMKTNVPSRRIPGLFVHDEKRHVTVLYGGFGTTLGDTWEWDGSAWSFRDVMGPFTGGSMASTYDSGRGVVVMYGGTNDGIGANQTWEWNGTAWTLRTALGPPQLWDAAMAYDRKRSHSVLFGGSSLGGTTYYADTWTWDGTAWAKLSPATSPPSRAQHALAYDVARDRVVLFGGVGVVGISYKQYGDTWEWDGTAWTQKSPSTSPSARINPSMTWDPVRKKVILFGGESYPKAFADTWAWDGSNWQPIAADPEPFPHGSVRIAAETATRKLAIFGGSDNSVWEATTRGGACSVDDDCHDLHCADGVCCDTACGGGAEGCRACRKELGSIADGTCSIRPSGATCRPSRSSCDPSETCDGVSAACPSDVVAAAGTPCSTASCADGVAVTSAVCDDLGLCSSTTTTCAPYVCGSTTCKTVCIDDADCIATHQCDGGICVERPHDAGADLGVDAPMVSDSGPDADGDAEDDAHVDAPEEVGADSTVDAMDAAEDTSDTGMVADASADESGDDVAADATDDTRLADAPTETTVAEDAPLDTLIADTRPAEDIGLDAEVVAPTAEPDPSGCTCTEARGRVMSTGEVGCAVALAMLVAGRRRKRRA